MFGRKGARPVPLGKQEKNTSEAHLKKQLGERNFSHAAIPTETRVPFTQTTRSVSASPSTNANLLSSQALLDPKHLPEMEFEKYLLRIGRQLGSQERACNVTISSAFSCMDELVSEVEKAMEGGGLEVSSLMKRRVTRVITDYTQFLETILVALNTPKNTEPTVLSKEKISAILDFLPVEWDDRSWSEVLFRVAMHRKTSESINLAAIKCIAEHYLDSNILSPREKRTRVLCRMAEQFVERVSSYRDDPHNLLLGLSPSSAMLANATHQSAEEGEESVLAAFADQINRKLMGLDTIRNMTHIAGDTFTEKDFYSLLLRWDSMNWNTEVDSVRKEIAEISQVIRANGSRGAGCLVLVPISSLPAECQKSLKLYSSADHLTRGSALRRSTTGNTTTPTSAEINDPFGFVYGRMLDGLEGDHVYIALHPFELEKDSVRVPKSCLYFIDAVHDPRYSRKFSDLRAWVTSPLQQLYDGLIFVVRDGLKTAATLYGVDEITLGDLFSHYNRMKNASSGNNVDRGEEEEDHTMPLSKFVKVYRVYNILRSMFESDSEKTISSHQAEFCAREAYKFTTIWIKSLCRAAVFPLDLDKCVLQMHHFLERVDHVVQIESQRLLSIAENSMKEIADRIQAVVSGERKDEVSSWWLSAIETEVDRFLTTCGYDHDAVNADYTDRPPAQIEPVQRNFKIVTELLRSFDKPIQQLILNLTSKVYTVVDRFIVDSKEIIHGKLHLIMGLNERSGVQVTEQTMSDLQMDLDYLERMKMMDEKLLSQIRNGKVESAGGFQMTDVVPISGLVMARFHIVNSELHTVLDLWDIAPDMEDEVEEEDDEEDEEDDDEGKYGDRPVESREHEKITENKPCLEASENIASQAGDGIGEDGDDGEAEVLPWENYRRRRRKRDVEASQEEALLMHSKTECPEMTIPSDGLFSEAAVASEEINGRNMGSLSSHPREIQEQAESAPRRRRKATMSSNKNFLDLASSIFNRSRGNGGGAALHGSAEKNGNGGQQGWYFDQSEQNDLNRNTSFLSAQRSPSVTTRERQNTRSGLRGLRLGDELLHLMKSESGPLSPRGSLNFDDLPETGGESRTTEFSAETASEGETGTAKKSRSPSPSPSSRGTSPRHKRTHAGSVTRDRSPLKSPFKRRGNHKHERRHSMNVPSSLGDSPASGQRPRTQRALSKEVMISRFMQNDSLDSTPSEGPSPLKISPCKSPPEVPGQFLVKTPSCSTMGECEQRKEKGRLLLRSSSPAFSRTENSVSSTLPFAQEPREVEGTYWSDKLQVRDGKYKRSDSDRGRKLFLRSVSPSPASSPASQSPTSSTPPSLAAKRESESRQASGSRNAESPVAPDSPSTAQNAGFKESRPRKGLRDGASIGLSRTQSCIDNKTVLSDDQKP